MQPNTRRNLKNSRRRLTDHFGAERALDAISAGDADDWRQAMVNAGLAEASISKSVKHAKQFLRLAHRKGLVASNPFQDLRAGGERNDARQHFVVRATIERVIAVAPDARWRLILALSRFGGLRCPSEHLALKWGDVDWKANRLNVPSPKTARHGKAYRTVPMFPELRPYLQSVLDELLASDFDPKANRLSEQPVITEIRDASVNLRTMLLRILKRAGGTTLGEVVPQSAGIAANRTGRSVPDPRR
jgi:integrase